MHAGIRTEIADFFESISKQSNITTLNWGKGGVQVLFEMSVTGRVFFEEAGPQGTGDAKRSATTWSAPILGSEVRT